MDSIYVLTTVDLTWGGPCYNVERGLKLIFAEHNAEPYDQPKTLVTRGENDNLR